MQTNAHIYRINFSPDQYTHANREREREREEGVMTMKLHVRHDSRQLEGRVYSVLACLLRGPFKFLITGVRGPNYLSLHNNMHQNIYYHPSDR